VQRHPGRPRRRPRGQQQHDHDGDEQVRDRVRGREAHHPRVLPDLPEDPPGQRRPGQRQQRAGDQHAVDAQHDPVAAQRGLDRPGQRHRTGHQGEHGEQRQDQEADVGGPLGDRPAGLEDVADRPPQADGREAGEPGADQQPPAPARAGPVPGGGEAGEGGERADGGLGRVGEQALAGSGGHRVRADRRDGGDEHQRHG
jgi:hypothetical protein